MSEDPASAGAPDRSCPICAKPAARPYLPFCSRRCADLDLGLWLKGAYSIPAVEPPDGMSQEEAAETLARRAGEEPE